MHVLFTDDRCENKPLKRTKRFHKKQSGTVEEEEKCFSSSTERRTVSSLHNEFYNHIDATEFKSTYQQLIKTDQTVTTHHHQSRNGSRRDYQQISLFGDGQQYEQPEQHYKNYRVRPTYEVPPSSF